MQSLIDFWQRFKLLPSAWLLMVQLVMLFIAPFTNDGVTSNAISWILGATALLLIAKIIQSTAIYTVVGLCCVVPALFLSLLIYSGNQSASVVITANLFEAAAYFCAAYGLTRYMFADRYLTRDELFAAACVFTLMVWAFAFLYSACQTWDSSSFNLEDKHPRTWLALIFLSFSVQSGTGLSDILPIGNLARVLVALQMFFGVMYLALIVSRLIALQYIAHLPKPKNDQDK